jgi:hypothetical protein
VFLSRCIWIIAGMSERVPLWLNLPLLADGKIQMGMLPTALIATGIFGAGSIICSYLFATGVRGRLERG